MVIGGIGCGNMGGAILNGIGKLKECEIIGYDHNIANMSALSESCGMRICEDELAVAEQADIIIIGVKPYAVEAVLKKISPVLTKDKVIISLAAGVSFARIKNYNNEICPAVIIMPNTPAMVGQGCCALCFDDESLPSIKKTFIHELFSKLATVTVLTEAQLPQFSALMGSGPAFVFYMQEAMMEAAIRLGFKQNESKILIDKLFEGSANLAQFQQNTHYATLRLNVCSPKGSTIVGMNALDKNGVRSGIIEAVLATHARAEEMANEK